MYKKIPLFFTVFLTLFALVQPLTADVRKENIELFLVIDKSKSMVEEISDVSSYINSVFIEDFLIPGDRLVMIQFFGKAEILYDGIVTKQNMSSITDEISAMEADGRFTDIGNALDKLDKAVNTGDQVYKRRYLLLLTDGKQEAPPESPYYTPDGSFNHRFLENTKIIQRAGWKIMILGIGQDTAVSKLAEELGTTHETIDFSEPPNLKTKSDIIGRIIATDFRLENNEICLNLASEGYETERMITIEQITYQLSTGNYALLDSSYTSIVPAGGTAEVRIRISDSKLGSVKNENEPGTVIFKFAGDTPFLPAVFDSILITTAGDNLKEADNKVSEKIEKAGNKNINWLIIVIVILAAAAILAFIIIRNIVSHRDDDEKYKRKKNEISGDS